MPLAGNGDGLQANVEVTYAPLASTFSRSVDYQFTNRLKVYLSGDTGLHADMKTIVNGLLIAAAPAVSRTDAQAAGHRRSR